MDSLVKTALEVLTRGGILVAPTDTVYGLLVDATSPAAVAKLIAFKDRPVGKAISVFVDSYDMMDKYVDTKFLTPGVKSTLPGPYTLVLPSKHAVVRDLESESGTLGVRYIDHSLINELVHTYGRPLTATSANLAGKSTCSSLGAFKKQLSTTKAALIDYMIDGGDLPRRKSSTVIDLSMPTPVVLRQGDSTPDVLSVEGKTLALRSQSANETLDIAQNFISSRIENSEKKSDAPLVILLHGELGSGKTQFVKGLARYFAIDDITSPTYTTCNEYELNDLKYNKLYHYDLYNLKTKEDVESVHISTNMKPNSIVCIEWPDVADTETFEQIDRANAWKVYIKYINEHERLIYIGKLP